MTTDDSGMDGSLEGREITGTEDAAEEKKVVNLSEEKAKRKGRPKGAQPADKPKGPSERELIDATVATMLGEAMGTHAFDYRAAVIETDNGVRLSVEIGPEDVVRVVDKDSVQAAICRWWKTHPTPSFWGLGAHAAEQAYRKWRLLSPPLPAPRDVLFKSTEGYCYHRIPFDPQLDQTGEKTPLFNEFLSRTTNSEALCAWIGSLFYPEADRQQYVWLYGSGGNGKGTLIRLLRRLMGPSCITEDAGQAMKGNQFWTSALIGKRLVAFPECGAPRFVRTPIFKQLTGGDAVRMELKGQAAFMADLTCKIICADNNLPEISSSRSDTRRAIFCECGDVTDPYTGPGGYEAALWAEMPWVIGCCLQIYESICLPDNGPIPVSAESLKDAMDDYNSQFEGFFEKYFEEEKDEHLPYSSQKSFSPANLARLFAADRISRSGQLEFKKWMLNVKGIALRVLKDGQRNSKKVYVGARLRTEALDRAFNADRTMED